MSEANATFTEWAILELMGHRRLAGLLSEQEIAGVAFIRIDVPIADGLPHDATTQFYAPAAVYCITPTTEEIARAVAKGNQPEPAHRWELPAPKITPEKAFAAADAYHSDEHDAEHDGDEDEDGEED